MRIILISLAILLSSAQATSYEVAQKSCELYNDLKHKKNSSDIHLEVGTSYKIMREQSDHYYVYVPNVTIPNRWVAKECFEESNSSVTQDKNKEWHIPKQSVSKTDYSTIEKPKTLLLALSWQNAFCQTHSSKRECHRVADNYKYDNKFVLHGLWPQPQDNAYCGVSPQEKSYDKNHQWNRIGELNLSDQTRKVLERVMPGVASNLHRHEWIKHGTCYATPAEEYFQDAIILTNQINRSKLTNFFTTNQDQIITLQQVRFKVDESFGKGSGKRVEMVCQDGLITELRFHIGYGSNDLTQLLREGEAVRSRCSRGKIDRAGF